jgi:hypothetical protein
MTFASSIETAPLLRLMASLVTTMVFASCGGNTHELSRSPDAGGSASAGSTSTSSGIGGSAAGGSTAIDAPVGGDGGSSAQGGVTSNGGSASPGGKTASTSSGGSSARGGAGGSSIISSTCCAALYCPSGYTLLGAATTPCPAGSECLTFNSCGCNLVLCARIPGIDGGGADAAGGSGGRSGGGTTAATGGAVTGGAGATGTGGTNAGGAAGGAGGGGGQGGSKGGATACQGASSLDRSCVADSDCLAARHQINCCGSTVWLGINKAESSKFSALESACDATYPACGCASREPTTDDGSSLPYQYTAGVGCQGGVCKTYSSLCGHACDTGRKCVTCGQGDAGVSTCSLVCTSDVDCTEPAYSRCSGSVCMGANQACTGY